MINRRHDAILPMVETGLKPMNVRDAVTSFPTNPKIGFIGLGNMGAALAMRLLDPGLMVYDPDQTAMKPFIDGGAIAASDLAAMARQCDIIFASPSINNIFTSAIYVMHWVLLHIIYFACLVCRHQDSSRIKGLVLPPGLSRVSLLIITLLV